MKTKFGKNKEKKRILTLIKERIIEALPG